MLPDGTAATTDTNEVTITSAGVSNKGIKREVNEDAFSILEKSGYQVFLVADGLGGPKRGAVASNLALSSIRIALKEFSTFDNPSILGDAVARANKDVFEKASASKTLHGMGTTVTGLVVANNHIFTAHVGNSRIYKIAQGKIKQLTVDHTVVEELRREGIEPSPDLDLRPKSHLLTRSLGVKPTLDVEVISHPEVIQSGDMFLLCTDGLHDLVSDEEMASLVMAHPIKDAAHLLINLSNERGGHDNITVVLMQVGKRELRGGGPVSVAPKAGASIEEKVSERSARRSTPIKGRIRGDRGSDRVSIKPVRIAVPGRELLDLRERDDDGEMVPVRAGRLGRKRLKPPTPAASSSGGRGAQRLPPSTSLGASPLSRRLPPLTQRIEERKGKEGRSVSSGGALRAKAAPPNRSAVGVEVSEAGGPVSIELSTQPPVGAKPSVAKQPSGSATTKPQLLSSTPASRVGVRTQDILGIGLGLALVGGFVVTRMISTTPTTVGRPQKSGQAVDENSTRPAPEVGDDEVKRSVEKGGASIVGEGDVPIQTPGSYLRGKENIRPPQRRADSDAFREVKQEGVSRIKDTMLRAMVLDVIEAIQQAVQDVEDKLGYLEDDDRERGERLKRMIEISKEATAKRKPVARREGDGTGPGKGAVKESLQESPESLEQKKQRLIEKLPDADPFGKE